MTALNSQGGFGFSLKIWHVLKKEAKAHQVRSMLSPALEALCYQDGPDAAIQELDHFALKRSERESASTLLTSQRPDLRHLYNVELSRGIVQIDIRTINLLMESLMRRPGGTSHILALWYSLDAYQLHPNDLTLGLIVNAARQTLSSGSGSFSIRMGSYGDAYWDNEKLWKTVDKVFRSVVLDPRDRVKELLSSAPSESPFPTLSSNAWPRFTEGSIGDIRADEIKDGHDVLSKVSMRPDTGAKYAHLIPSDRTFRNYIRLMASLEMIEQMPLILTWMRALDVTPSWQTLTAILAHSDEIPLRRKASLASPLRSAWTQGWGPGGDEKLESDLLGFRDWIADWLECSRFDLPQNDDIARYRRMAQEHLNMSQERDFNQIESDDV